MITKFKLISTGVMVALASGCATTTPGSGSEEGVLSGVNINHQCVAVAAAASGGCFLYNINSSNPVLKSAACFGAAYLACHVVSNYVSKQEKSGEELRKTSKPSSEPKLVNYATTVSPKKAALDDGVVLESTVSVVAPANQQVSIQEKLVMVDQQGNEWINKVKDIAVSDGGVYSNTFKFQPGQARLVEGTYDVKRQVIVQGKPLGKEKTDKLEVKGTSTKLSLNLLSN